MATHGVFTSDADERVVGLGQHSAVGPSSCSSGKSCGQWKLDQKGFTWPLGVTKFQIMVPFFVSSKRYGFLWNHPGEGTVAVGNQTIAWNSTAQPGVDFWVVAAADDDDGAYPSIMRAYADATGHAPVLPDAVTGFWQSKMRYRTSDELLDVAAGFASRKIPLSVLVIDFYTWTRFGDFRFDPTCWPNASAMTAGVAALTGAKVLRSTYPWVDPQSVNYGAAVGERVLVLDAATGAVSHPSKGLAVIDPFAPGAAEFVWSRVKASFFDHGIDMFWLDDTEPNVPTAGLLYHCGPAEYCGALWPQRWVEIFRNGTRAAGVASPVMLTRAAWAGFQTTGAVLWSSDIPSTFESLRVQVRAGLSTMMSGLPWWTTDVGGFVGGDVRTPEFRELLVRWYQFGAVCPIFRTHGARVPAMTPLPSEGSRFREPGARCSAPSGVTSGSANEPWAFGNDTEGFLVAMIRLRESLRGYVGELARSASSEGAPPMRPLFYHFPGDDAAWRVDDEFMLGPRLLAAPVLQYLARNRTVYFPEGGGTLKWVHRFTNASYAPGTTAVVPAPLQHFPLFDRVVR